MSLYSDTLALIRRYGLLDGVRTAVVALSGGPDSVCLFDVLALAAERGAIGAALHAAHLNHGLRGAESDGDEAFARELAQSRGVPITVERRDVAAVRSDRGGSLEDAARVERYGFLAAVAESAGAGAVAVGHHADDQVETVLHRLIRGTGLRGMRGMPVRRPIRLDSAVMLIRPLLRSRRADILAHLDARGLRYRADSSNADESFLRNRVRANLLPLLRSEYNPAFGESLLRLAQSAADAHELLEELASSAGAVDGPRIDLAAFRAAHPALRPLLVDRALAAVPASSQPGAAHYDAVAELALDGPPGGRIDLPGGVAAVRSRTELTFTRTPDPAVEPFEVAVRVPGRTEASGRGLAVEAALLDRADFDFGAFLAGKTCYDEALDADRVAGRLVLRSRRPGDRFRPLGAPGEQTVGDFLTDRKVDPAGRARAAVVADEFGPVWLVGHRIDDRVRITDETSRVLRVSASRPDTARPATEENR